MRVYKLENNGVHVGVYFLTYTSALAKKIELEADNKKNIIKIIKEE